MNLEIKNNPFDRIREKGILEQFLFKFFYNVEEEFNFMTFAKDSRSCEDTVMIAGDALTWTPLCPTRGLLL